ncbi:uncharacterized protein L969DRAFT_67603 [Mixia osmundae IAM 14324]|uniref:HECT-type E3 ubiquitin transferase n=1 Tax=Mixia osmundae (strain CBS 9802 / IAM 14324 / JCM 22182 / KY 12970) TaxID=764103 RepID=G7E892_MIXOS|nr:uncharacterized protein L969DRAFT_67603 [Mixia osmundae IAM 14324]KEI36545.1 hypothetical protein L969DRAFT_67603 [Mixia osmundae IAM 14324]GAA99052.1 hypothetical protein E5Q_05741 [Mixia osmundae IAM 14324]
MSSERAPKSSSLLPSSDPRTVPAIQSPSKRERTKRPSTSGTAALRSQDHLASDTSTPQSGEQARPSARSLGKRRAISPLSSERSQPIVNSASRNSSANLNPSPDKSVGQEEPPTPRRTRSGKTVPYRSPKLSTTPVNGKRTKLEESTGTPVAAPSSVSTKPDKARSSAHLRAVENIATARARVATPAAPVARIRARLPSRSISPETSTGAKATRRIVRKTSKPRSASKLGMARGGGRAARQRRAAEELMLAEAAEAQAGHEAVHASLETGAEEAAMRSALGVEADEPLIGHIDSLAADPLNESGGLFPEGEDEDDEMMIHDEDDEGEGFEEEQDDEDEDGIHHDDEDDNDYGGDGYEDEMMEEELAFAEALERAAAVAASSSTVTPANAAAPTTAASAPPASSSTGTTLQDPYADAAAAFGTGAMGLFGLRRYGGHNVESPQKFKTILTDLRNKHNANVRLIALQELSELLSISTEDTLAGYFSPEQYTKELVAILRNGGGAQHGDPEFGTSDEGGASEEGNVEMMLLACRCLANLMEALPGSAHSVVYNGAVPVLCAKLLEIQFIDLAEQTLSTLEKISQEMPSSIVREGGLSALLTYLDFFSTNVQRTALTTVANSCRSVSPDHFEMTRDALPVLRNVLGYSDQRVVEQACLAVTRIVDSYRAQPDKLEKLLTSETLDAVLNLLHPGGSSVIGPSTYTSLLRMLGLACKVSPIVAIDLIEKNVTEAVYQILTGSSAPPAGQEGDGLQTRIASGDMAVLQSLVQRPKEQIQETLFLVSELMPALPKDGIFDNKRYTREAPNKLTASLAIAKPEEATDDPLDAHVSSIISASPTRSAASQMLASSPARDSAPVDVKSEGGTPDPSQSLAEPLSGSTSRTLLRATMTASPRSSQVRDSEKEAANKKRVAILTTGSPARLSHIKRFYALMLPTLIEVYSASVSAAVRSKTVLGMLKALQFCNDDHLAGIMDSVPMAGFLASVLSTRDQISLVMNALQMVEILLLKLQDTYQYHFRREGVMHEIMRISKEPLLSPLHGEKGPGELAVPPTAASQAHKLLSKMDDSQADFLRPPNKDRSGGLGRALKQSAGDSGQTTPKLLPHEELARDAITLRARHLIERFGEVSGDSVDKADSKLQAIRDLVERLDMASAEEGPERAKHVLDAITSLFSESSGSISSFELLESGLIDGLLRFASDGRTEDGMARRHKLLLTSLRSSKGGAQTPMSALVHRLQDALSRLEDFDVITAPSPNSEASRSVSSARLLAKQLRLKLVAEDETNIPRSCSNVVVSIHAIATFQAFNDYLRPRIIAANNTSNDRGSSSAGSRLAGAMAALIGSAGAPHATDAVAPKLKSPTSPSIPSTSAGTSKSSPANGGTTLSSRRRSDRLSAKGSKGSADDLAELAANDAEVPCEAARSTKDVPAPLAPAARAPSNLLEGEIQTSEPVTDERPVSLQVASDGSKIEASTPDGTRVSTPKVKADANSGKPPTPHGRGSYAAIVKTDSSDWHLEFTLAGKKISFETTIFGAVHQHELSKGADASPDMWQSVHTVRFKKVPGPSTLPREATPSSGIKTFGLPTSIDSGRQHSKVLQLLRILHSINFETGDDIDATLAPPLPASGFVNNKLSAKLNRQLEEPMIVASQCLPSWVEELPVFAPFLFPFETRVRLLRNTSFGYARLLNEWLSAPRTDGGRRDDSLSFLGRLQRQKVRISRARLLESAVKVFELYGGSRAMLEVEYFEEVGTGLGPTLEFFSLVSKEFARSDLKLWREGDVGSISAYVYNLSGLFPAPLSSQEAETEAGRKRLAMFTVLGQFVAKGLMDSRILDLSFSRSFSRLVQGERLPETISSVKSIDRALGNSLTDLQAYADAKTAVKARELGQEAEREAMYDIRVRDARVEDLALDFTLPGYGYDLKENGSDCAVDIENVEEYIRLVIQATVSTGIAAQVCAFRDGFSTVFPIQDMNCFTPDELVHICGSAEEDWSMKTLTDGIRADHGFNMDSSTIRNFLTILTAYDASERRDFLQFMTGSSKLPIGGFRALTPALTVVRKPAEAPLTSDQYLPSVMTCQNYLKLPAYSSLEIMSERLHTAIKEGSGAFHLS